MKTTKLFFMAALALMTAACSNDDNDLTTQQPQKAEGITITAQLAPKTNGATTRAVSDGTDKIVAEWAVNEHIAILYEVGGTKYAADATITGVDGSGAATIEFTVEAGTPNNTACTLVYPLSAAKDDHTGVKDAATLLASQDGTLNANLDVRVGAGTIQTTTPSLEVTTQPKAQFAIFKFTVKNSDASATIDVKPLTVTIGDHNYVITPASATSELFAALPAVDDKAVSFSATGYTFTKTNVTFEAGKYYQSTLKMSAATTKGLSTIALERTYVAQNGDILTGTLTPGTSWDSPCIQIADGATITLKDVNINPDGSATGTTAGLTCLGDATIILEGSNTVKGLSQDNPTIQTAEGKTLTIMGTGSLDVSYGSGGGDNGEGAAIGGKGNINIQGGTIKAIGGSHSAAIGASCYQGTCGDITISGGTITAIASGGSAAIGSMYGGTCGDITITGGTIAARGANEAASIGSGSGLGDHTKCGNITITEGVTSVTALRGGVDSPYSIGLGLVGSGGSSTCGTVTIGGVVTGSISAGTYTYPTLTLNISSPVVGQIIGSDGKNYAPGSEPVGVMAVAMIAYVGSDMGEAPYNHGLALAYIEKDGPCTWSGAKSYCENMVPINGAKWMLPSQDQWKAMFDAFGGSSDGYSYWEGLKNAITTAGIIPFNTDHYWTSTEKTPGEEAYVFYLNDEDNWYLVDFTDDSESYSSYYARACFAF